MKRHHFLIAFFFLSGALSYIPEVQTNIPCNEPIVSSEEPSTYRPIVSFGLKNGGWVLAWVGPNLNVYFNLWSSDGTKLISAGDVLDSPDPTDPGEKELRGCGISTGGFVISYRTGESKLQASFFYENGTAVTLGESIFSNYIIYHYTLCSSDGYVWFLVPQLDVPPTQTSLKRSDALGNRDSPIIVENLVIVKQVSMVQAATGMLYALFFAENSKSIFIKPFTSSGSYIVPAAKVNQVADTNLPNICLLGNGNMVLAYTNYDKNIGYFRLYNGTTASSDETQAFTLSGDMLYKFQCATLGTEKFVMIGALNISKLVKRWVFWNNGTMSDPEYSYPASMDFTYPYIHSMKDGGIIISYTNAPGANQPNERSSHRYNANLQLISTEPCEEGGYDCDGSTGFCAGCVGDKFFNDSDCLSNCPSGFKEDLVNKFCFKCPQGCSNCTNSSSCSICDEGYTKVNGDCIPSAGCPSTCNTCASSSFCYSCKPSFYLSSNNLCEASCPSNQYTDSINRRCVACVGNQFKLIKGTCVLTSSLISLEGGSIFCTSPALCGKYINTNNYIFTFTNPLIDDYSKFEYFWSVDELSSTNYSLAIERNLYIIANNHTLSGNSITISLLMYSLTHFVNISTTLLLNTPPSGGQLISNVNIGEALSTNFTFTTSSWADVDNPLNYTFYYISSGILIPLGPNSPSPSVTTVLPGNTNGSQTIYCYATDVYGASSNPLNITVQVNSPVNPLDNIQLVDNIIAALTPDKPADNIRTLVVASSQLSSINQLVPKGNPCDSNCSSHGVCQPDNICICDKDWTLDDCSLLTTKVNQIIQQKNQIFTLMGDNLKLFNSAEYQTSVMAAYNEGTIEPDFTDDRVLSTVVDVLENTLRINEPNTILNIEQSNSVANIMNNMLQIQGKRDCGLKGNFTIALENRTYTYLETFSRNTLRNTAPTQAPEQNLNFEFDLFTKTISLCNINNYEIKTSPDSPIITLRYIEPNLDCRQTITIQYYVFRPDIFLCRSIDSFIASPNKTSTKSLIAIGLKQEGTPLNLSIKPAIKMPASVLCPKDCDTDPVTKTCLCRSLDPFDIKGQISRIFSASKLSLIGNFGVLLSFKYWEHAFFWLLLAYCTWYIMTMYLVWTKFKRYNVVEKYTKRNYTSWKNAFYTIFITKNPMFSPCFHEDEKLAKLVRVTLYFSRGMLILAYNSIFSNVALTKDGQYYFSVYLIILPYMTFVPIMLIITVLLKVEPGKQLTKGQKIKLGIGAFITLAVLIACFFIILILGAQSTADERKAFAINFVITIIQDLIVNPSVGTVILFALYMIYTRGIKPLQKALNHPKVRKGLEDAIGKDGFEVAKYLDSYKKKIYVLREDLVEKFHLSMPKKINLRRRDQNTRKEIEIIFKNTTPNERKAMYDNAKSDPLKSEIFTKSPETKFETEEKEYLNNDVSIEFVTLGLELDVTSSEKHLENQNSKETSRIEANNQEDSSEANLKPMIELDNPLSEEKEKKIDGDGDDDFDNEIDKKNDNEIDDRREDENEDQEERDDRLLDGEKSGDSPRILLEISKMSSQE